MNRLAVAGRGRFGLRALTLVEVLVVIGIIGLLVGILVPSLSEARRSARRTQSLSNLQRIGQAFVMYTESHRGAHPFMNSGQMVQVGCSSGSKIGSSGFWVVAAWWPSLLHEVLPWPADGGVFLSPGARRDDFNDGCGWPTSYRYSDSFVARPELWRPGAVEDDRLLAPTYAHELRHPAAKVMVYDAELPFLSERRYLGPDLLELTPMLFADGHAEQRVPAEAVEPIALSYFIRPVRLMHTPDGVRGRDY